MNAHLKIRVAKVDIQRVIASLELCPGFNDDEQLKADMLEGETELFEIVRRLLNENEDDEGAILALKAQIEDRNIRKARAEQRRNARREERHLCQLVARATGLRYLTDNVGTEMNPRLFSWYSLPESPALRDLNLSPFDAAENAAWLRQEAEAREKHERSRGRS
jgi:hypothetical protein